MDSGFGLGHAARGRVGDCGVGQQGAYRVSRGLASHHGGITLNKLGGWALAYACTRTDAPHLRGQPFARTSDHTRLKVASVCPPMSSSSSTRHCYHHFNQSLSAYASHHFRIRHWHRHRPTYNTTSPAQHHARNSRCTHPPTHTTCPLSARPTIPRGTSARPHHTHIATIAAANHRHHIHSSLQ